MSMDKNSTVSGQRGHHLSSSRESRTTTSYMAIKTSSSGIFLMKNSKAEIFSVISVDNIEIQFLHIILNRKKEFANSLITGKLNLVKLKSAFNRPLAVVDLFF